MKKIIISNTSDMLAEEVMDDIMDKIATIDPDSIDAIIQKAVDDLETMTYDKVLTKVNTILEDSGDRMDKWW